MLNRKLMPIFALLMAALGCNLTSTAVPPTPSPVSVTLTVDSTLVALATSVHLTAQAIETQPETEQPASETPAPAPTDTPAAGITPPPGPKDQETILILEPGINPSGVSSVTSPVHVAGQSESTFEQSLVIQVADENGAIIATIPTQILADMGQRGPFSADVPFKVASDQPGRISVFATSARDGGLTHLASVEVKLLAGGSASIVSSQPHPETIAIFTPEFLTTLSGGTVHVTGFSDYVFESQLGLRLCGEGGSGAPDPICGTVDNILGEGVAMLHSPEMGQPGPFEGDIAYKISTSMSGRVVVFHASPRDGGLTHVGTVEVRLEP